MAGGPIETAVILVVEGEYLSFGRLAGLVGRETLDLATTVAEARERLGATAPTAMVVGGPVADEATDLVEDVRAGRLGPPWLGVLAVTAAEDRWDGAAGVDSTVRRSADGPALEAALERTVLLGRYRRAIQSFFDACHERPGAASPGASLREARLEADTCLEAIQAREEPIPIDRLLEGA